MKRQLLALMMSGTLAATGAAADSCFDKAISDAAKVRYLQTSFMVAALQCRGTSDIRTRYNKFVSSNKARLSGDYQKLSAALVRSGQGKIDNYLVREANGISAKSYSVDGFCDRLDTLLYKALSGTDPLDLVAALPVPYTPKVKQCRTATMTASAQ